MSDLKNISFIGGDKRAYHMAKFFHDNNYNVYMYNISNSYIPSSCTKLHTLQETLSLSRLIVLPIPVSKNSSTINSTDISLNQLYTRINSTHFIFGGKLPKSLINVCEEKNIFFKDFLSDSSVAIMNAISTAEGTILEAINKSCFNLHGSHCLVLGYGKCASILSHKLKGLDAHVTVAARKHEVQCQIIANGFSSCSFHDIINIIHTFDYIFNTVPALILTPDILDKVKKDVCIIDIASYPGGVDFDYAKSLDLNAGLYLGLPGKVSSKSSSDILSNVILHSI